MAGEGTATPPLSESRAGSMEDILGHALEIHRNEVARLRSELKVALDAAGRAKEVPLPPNCMHDNLPVSLPDVDEKADLPTRAQTSQGSQKLAVAGDFNAVAPIPQVASEASMSRNRHDDVRWSMMDHIGEDRSNVFESFSRRRKQNFEALCGTARSREGRTAHKIVKGAPFTVCTFALIITSSIFLGANTQNQLDCAISGCVVADWWGSVELMFDVMFTIEVFMKFLAEDIYMWMGDDWFWNCLDTFLVLSGWVKLLAGNSLHAGMSVSRVVRLARLFRILRVVRVVRVCSKLRVMVYTIVSSMDALFWVCAVLLLFGYIFAMVFMQATMDKFEQGGDEEQLQALQGYFGGLYLSLITLFQSFSGGMDWGDIYETLKAADEIYSVVFLFYMYLHIMLVMNVVTGTVVESTTRIAQKDEEKMITDEMGKVQSYMKDIESFFKMTDKDGSGRLSWQEFEMVLQDDKMKAHFQKKLDMEARQAHKLFMLLDVNKDGQVGIQEFLDGCMRLRGQASGFDLHLAIFSLQKLANAWKNDGSFARGRSSADAGMLD
jgi:voltage-gated sodium channel